MPEYNMQHNVRYYNAVNNNNNISLSIPNYEHIII